ncbi:50S ribosomal protein L20 [Candidatus Trichorickettsia mobilis]|uniref:Large ribosomal subunit protein bL20 n=1 Tax=Candidatus Trichorickettsia mobilis TaxID=1346319 RepID=A0ABZ0UTI9_9RICK|nr:50S ribosomal protein L20 [Candidatus Trichorickettsia mobilis]WPY00402.1 50S ribosomal protein L20 [Candidatus Trichorickettsia mobilis]
MSRAKSGKISKNRHKKILKLAKGYRGRAKNCFRIAIEKVEKALQYAYRDRRNRKRDFRGLWIQRINAAARIHGMVYSQLVGGLKKAAVDIDRKMLSELAVNNPEAFAQIVEQAKSAMLEKAL